MMQKEYFFDMKNGYTSQNIATTLHKMVKPSPFLVVVCIGSDITIGDSLGPLVGTMIEKRNFNNVFLYGTLKSPITAKEVISLEKNIKKLHPYTPIIAIDAAVGNEKEVGQIKLQSSGLYPGIGVGKKINCIGDFSIMGIVAKRSKRPFQELQSTRLSFVYKQAIEISTAVSFYLEGAYGYQNFNIART